MEEMYLETVDRSTEIVLDMKHNVHLSSPQPKGFSHGLHAGRGGTEYWQLGAPWAAPRSRANRHWASQKYPRWPLFCGLAISLKTCFAQCQAASTLLVAASNP